MKRWLGTICYYATAFVAYGALLAVSYALYTRVQRGSAEPGDSYWSIVAILPALLTIFPLMLASWLLRRLARWFAWTRGWQWLVAGTVLGWLVVWGAGHLGLSIERVYFSPDWQKLKAGVMFTLLGPMMFTFAPWWLPLPAVAATSGVLFLLQRAFGWQTASKEMTK